MPNRSERERHLSNSSHIDDTSKRVAILTLLGGLILTIEETKAVAETIQSVATTLALLIGGCWTYFRFVRQRTESAQGWVEGRASSLSLKSGHRLLDVECELGNAGKVLLPIRLVKSIVRQVLPLDDGTSFELRSCGPEYAFPWPELARREWRWPTGAAEIEPGESQTLSWSFELEPHVEIVELLVYFEDATSNPKKGWSKRLLINLSEKEKEKPMQLTVASDHANPTSPQHPPKVPDPDSVHPKTTSH